MILLPVPTAEAINILNLPAELASNPVFEEHAALVLAQIEALVDPDAYVLATTEGDEDPSPALQVAFRFGFAWPTANPPSGSRWSTTGVDPNRPMRRWRRPASR